MQKKHGIALVALAFAAVGTAGFLYVRHSTSFPPPAAGHVIELSERPKFLTEETALSCAREALKQDGLEPADWRPVPNGRTRAPDGRVDAYMARTEGTLYRGVILFARGGRTLRFVAVELRGARVICQNPPGK
jgi:hypothetical protein